MRARCGKRRLTHFIVGRGYRAAVNFWHTRVMKMTGFPLSTTDWAQLAPAEHAGERGVAFWRTQNFGEVRVRMMEYSPGYAADHWCSKEHIILCIEGELETTLSDGKIFVLTPGMSYQVADGESSHQSATKIGAKLFIVD